MVCVEQRLPVDAVAGLGPFHVLREITIIRSMTGTLGLVAHLTRLREPPG
jgi:hypothetical protein